MSRRSRICLHSQFSPSYCSRLAVLPPVNLKTVRNRWHRIRFWNSALCTHRTARAAMARKGVEERRLRLANPVYLAIVDESAVHNVVANGVRGTSMPAFAQSAGGMLTEEQIKVITSGMFSRWGRKGILDGANPPSYAAKTTGDVARGEIAFGTYCASCHGSEGRWIQRQCHQQ